MHELTGWSRDLSVEVAGHGVASHTGSVAATAAVFLLAYPVAGTLLGRL